jgi:hypothetical protein
MRHPAKDEGENERGQQGLEQKPDGAEDGLLVFDSKVAPDQHREQVAVTPEFAKIYQGQRFVRPDAKFNFHERKNQLKEKLKIEIYFNI